MQTSRFGLAILFVTLVVINTGFGIIMPILPYYAQNMGASATILGGLSALYAALQFLFAPVWGRLSDRVGRRPILLIGLVGFSISFFIFGLASQLWMLFLARIIGGIISSATLPTALAYIADTTQPGNRARGMSLMGAAGGIGMILGPVLGGFLAVVSIQAPFFSAAILALLVAIFGFFLLPESLPSRKDPLDPDSMTVHDTRFQLIQKAMHGPLAFLLILAALSSFGMAQLESTGALYAKERFGMGSGEMGLMFILMGVLGVAAQFLLVARLIRRFGEHRLIQLSLAGVGASFLFFGLSRAIGPAVLAVILLGLSTALTRPALNTLISRLSPASQQGMYLGLVNSFYSLGMMFGPILGGFFYDHLGISAPFYSGAIVHAAALLISLLLFSSQTVLPKT